MSLKISGDQTLGLQDLTVDRIKQRHRGSQGARKSPTTGTRYFQKRTDKGREIVYSEGGIRRDRGELTRLPDAVAERIRETGVEKSNSTLFVSCSVRNAREERNLKYAIY